MVISHEGFKILNRAACCVKHEQVEIERLSKKILRNIKLVELIIFSKIVLFHKAIIRKGIYCNHVLYLIEVFKLRML